MKKGDQKSILNRGAKTAIKLKKMGFSNLCNIA